MPLFPPQHTLLLSFPPLPRISHRSLSNLLVPCQHDSILDPIPHRSFSHSSLSPSVRPSSLLPELKPRLPHSTIHQLLHIRIFDINFTFAPLNLIPRTSVSLLPTPRPTSPSITYPQNHPESATIADHVMSSFQQSIEQYRVDSSFNIIDVLSCVLTELCEKQTQLPRQQVRNKFSALNLPSITIHQYLVRIDKYSQCSRECFILALIYIDRIIQSNETFIVTYYDIHRLLITAVMLAAKFFDDQYYNNSYYARVGGVDALEMNQLEVEFLFMNNFSLYVSTDTYLEYYRELRGHDPSQCPGCLASREALKKQQQAQQAKEQAVAHQQQQQQQAQQQQQQQQQSHEEEHQQQQQQPIPTQHAQQMY